MTKTQQDPTLSQKPKNALPRWRGFNFLEKFSTDTPAPRGGKGSKNPPFRETDFQWISDWGFDFVRLPMSYHCWSGPDRWMEVDEAALEDVDAAVEMGRRYGIHVCLNLHRAPGFCINPPAEPKSLWREADALAACAHHWRTLAKRYAGIPATRLSFDLLNEPPAPHMDVTLSEYQHVVRTLTAAIRGADAQRLVIADGLSWGNEPIPGLEDLGISQSCRGYLPIGVSHYKVPEMPGTDTFPLPTWPGGVHWGEPWDRARLEAHYEPWAKLVAQGIGVHCGECGCYNLTPHDVFLAWFRDVLEILTGHGIGYALWCLHGEFGILDSRRKDVAYKNWHGHALDEKLLKLLQEF